MTVCHSAREAAALCFSFTVGQTMFGNLVKPVRRACVVSRCDLNVLIFGETRPEVRAARGAGLAPGFVVKTSIGGKRRKEPRSPARQARQRPRLATHARAARNSDRTPRSYTSYVLVASRRARAVRAKLKCLPDVVWPAAAKRQLPPHIGVAAATPIFNEILLNVKMGRNVRQRNA